MDDTRQKEGMHSIWFYVGNNPGTVIYSDKKGIIHGHKETFGSDKYIYYLDCDDDFMGVYLC